jgi:hypothetical protein
MKTLENYNVVELNQNEITEISGGFFSLLAVGLWFLGGVIVGAILADAIL